MHVLLALDLYNSSIITIVSVVKEIIDLSCSIYVTKLENSDENIAINRKHSAN